MILRIVHGVCKSFKTGGTHPAWKTRSSRSQILWLVFCFSFRLHTVELLFFCIVQNIKAPLGFGRVRNNMFPWDERCTYWALLGYMLVGSATDGATVDQNVAVHHQHQWWLWLNIISFHHQRMALFKQAAVSGCIYLNISAQLTSWTIPTFQRFRVNLLLQNTLAIDGFAISLIRRCYISKSPCIKI